MSNKEPAIQPKTTYLKDYQAPNFWVDSIDLTFDLFETHTKVRAITVFSRNKSVSTDTPLVLDGHDLKLLSVALNGKVLETKDYQVGIDTLTIPNVPDNFTLQVETEIHPEKNTELSGLFRSKTMFCTQCEAQGFRRMTYFLDRPDVMTKFTTTIFADKDKYPVLLSNGNLIEKGAAEKGRHFAKWQDPFKKPCYLFALVAGPLVAIEDHFLTKSGRLVTLKIFVEWENQDKCAHAMAALKNAMKWDEETYGREYDLDIYMIVAVNDFNMGAMENKGLNIFNSKYVLARPETATDTDFLLIDVVIGHEYFHNWSGNRVTCRDWFQLSLKEGLTVFREHQFSDDISKSAVTLIDHAAGLRSHQFAEDAGPTAHPVRPESYVEINNFYTSTIYEKGAEVIRMIRTLLGKEKFRQGMDLYFERYDGMAVTCEDFVKAMEDASGQDLKQFRLWYSQAGTPEIEVEASFDAATKMYTLTLKQYCPPTPGQATKLPMHIPVAVGLVSNDGRDLIPTKILSLTEPTQSFQFENIAEKPRPSILREFSAPVKVKLPLSNEDLAFLLAHDSDSFNAWDSGQKLSERFILRLVDDIRRNAVSTNGASSNSTSANVSLNMDPLWMKAHQAVLENEQLNPALKVKMLTLPSTSYLIDMVQEADPDAFYHAKKFILETFAGNCRDKFLAHYHSNVTPGLYEYSTELAAKRSYKNLCLGFLTQIHHPESIELALHQWQYANNMTDAFGAVQALADVECKEREIVLNEFYDKWKHDPLVVNKWLRVQAGSILPNTLQQVKNLMQHEAFSITNPNNVYALIGGFSVNLVRFHDKSGAGYRFLADAIIELNKLNPQVAARMMDPFKRWRKFTKDRQEKMQLELERILAQPKLSRDVNEIAMKCLGEYRLETA